MSAILKFECRVPADGYRVLSLDERKLMGAEMNSGDASDVLPPSDLTEDELYLLKKWGEQILPWGNPPEEILSLPKLFFEPNSERIRRFDLFEEASDPHLEFANTPVTLEGAKALADRYGSLHGEGRPRYDFEWYNAIVEMRDAVKAWQSAKATGDFGRLIRSVARQGRRSIGKPDDSGIDANILLSKDPRSGEAQLCIRPSTLLNALWTKLALAIDGSESLRTCIECKIWFTTKAGRGRSDKEYCSDACRMRAYRKRKGKQ
jgi:hypothetical protein